MTLARKNLTLDADRLSELAARRGSSESEAARAAIEAALFADEFVEILRQLREAGYGVEDVSAPPVEEGPASDTER